MSSQTSALRSNFLTCEIPTDRATAIPQPFSVVASSRHTDETSDSLIPEDMYVIRLEMTPVSMKLVADGNAIWSGDMSQNALGIAAQPVEIRETLQSPARTFTFSLSKKLIEGTDMERHFWAEGTTSKLPIRTSSRFDPVTQQLCRLLIRNAEVPAGQDALFQEGIGLALVSRLLTQIFRGPADKKSFSGGLTGWQLSRVKEYIARRLSQPIGLSEMAATVNLSRMHFAARFRQSTGTSPYQYALGERVKCAQGALRETCTSLSQISQMCGFKSQAHFTRVFKQVTGSTPSDWRSMCRGVDRRQTNRVEN